MAYVLAWIFIACFLGALASSICAITDLIYDTYDRIKRYIEWKKKYDKRRNRWL